MQQDEEGNSKESYYRCYPILYEDKENYIISILTHVEDDENIIEMSADYRKVISKVDIETYYVTDYTVKDNLETI